MEKQNSSTALNKAGVNIKNIKVLDSTLRDGGQAEGISFSVEDKIKIVKLLDNLGVSYIEAGNPGSNPKDLEFFKRAKDITFKNAKLCAFGSTRKKGIKPEDDQNLKSLLSAETPVVVVFGKTWDFHVTDIIKTTLEENLLMIEQTVAFLKSKGKEIIFDAEHFFDGYKSNKDYAISCLLAAEKGGADCICLCETNGGAFPDEVFEIVTDVCKKVKTEVGIHTHNDTAMAVANSVMAVYGGANHIQGTLIGFGERCGNANLSSIIANLQLKKGYNLIPTENISELTSICRNVAEISNLNLDKGMPYVGKSAFTHKAGMHIDGVNKNSYSFEHVPPTSVGNERRFLMSEVAGRSTLVGKIQKFYPNITKESPFATKIIDKIKELEHIGYQFEGADATFELLVKKTMGDYKPSFSLERFKTIAERQNDKNSSLATATVKVLVGNQTEITAAEGDGPVNALDIALRKALERFYPRLKEVSLSDYKVRILDGNFATKAKTRVLIDTTDGNEVWSTVGVSTDIIEASLIALVDAIEYKLIKDNENK